MTLNLAQMRTYVRDLTGIYSTDIVSDALLSRWINDAYLSLVKSQNWPWSPFSEAGLVNALDEPPVEFVDRYISHMAAAKALAFEADDTTRAQAYTVEAQSLYEQLILIYLKPTAPDVVQNEADLIQYTRFLLDTYNNSITDQFIALKLKESFSEFYARFDWPFNGVSINPIPGQAGLGYENSRIFAFDVARRVAPQLGKDETFVAAMAAQFETSLEDLVLRFFEKVTPGTITNMASLVAYTRFIMDFYQDSVTDAHIELRLNEAMSELYNTYTWSFPNSIATGLGWSSSKILAYAVAIKLAPKIGATEAFVQAMQAQYDISLEELRVTRLVLEVPVGQTTLQELVRTVRLVTGNFSKAVSDEILSLWINEEYQLLANEKDWRWLQTTYQVSLAPGEQIFELPNGTSKVLEMYVVETDNLEFSAADVSQSEIVFHVPHVMDIERTSDKFNYAVTSNGMVTLSPSPERSLVVRVRYQQRAGALQSGDTPAMDEQFRSILAYRAGARVAAYTSADKGIVELCNFTAQRLYEAMDSYYQLDHSMEPFQVGGKSLESRKYLPWFRTA